MVATILPEYNKKNKILFINCYRTQALGIISVRLTEPEFTNIEFFKCETIKNSLEQGNYKHASLIPCDRVT